MHSKHAQEESKSYRNDRKQPAAENIIKTKQCVGACYKQ